MKKTLLFIICALNTVCFSFGMELETRKRKNSSPLPLSKRPRQIEEKDFCNTQPKEPNVTVEDKKNRTSDLYTCLVSEDPDYAQKEAAAIVEIANQIKEMTITLPFTGELVSFSTTNKK